MVAGTQVAHTCKPTYLRGWDQDTLKQLRPIGKGDQELEKRLDQKELT
jgi:hypothetical protein